MNKLLSTLTLLAVLCSTVTPSMAEAPSFKIIAGDVLQVSVWKEEGLDREVLVLPNGDITFPLIGTVSAQGMTPADLQKEIKTKLTKFIPDATVTVSVKAALGHTVNVIGQVNKPGEIIINRKLTAMQALSQAGGLTPYASHSNIIVIRHGENGAESVSIEIPYSDLIDGDDLDKDIALRPGDVLVVPTASLF